MLIGVDDDDDGYVIIRLITFAQALTGHSIGSLFLSCVTVSFFSWFFWNSKVMDIQSADSSIFELLFSSLFSLKKRKFLMQRSLVRRSLQSGTLLYSHDLMAK